MTCPTAEVARWRSDEAGPAPSETEFVSKCRQSPSIADATCRSTSSSSRRGKRARWRRWPSSSRPASSRPIRSSVAPAIPSGCVTTGLSGPFTPTTNAYWEARKTRLEQILA